MDIQILGNQAFRYLEATLQPGDALLTESDAMATMDAELDLKVQLFGGFLGGVAKKFLGGESLFVNSYSNQTSTPRSMHITSPTPGDVVAIELDERGMCLQAGSFICASPSVQFSTEYAGLGFMLAREGLFKLRARGPGTVWIGSYGAIVERQVRGEVIVDSGHIVAFEPQLSVRIQLAGGLISSVTSGEGLVARVEGEGRLYLQTRSLDGLAQWLNPKL